MIMETKHTSKSSQNVLYKKVHEYFMADGTSLWVSFPVVQVVHCSGKSAYSQRNLDEQTKEMDECLEERDAFSVKHNLKKLHVIAIHIFILATDQTIRESNENNV